ncbi:MAG: SEFIR domain-containing protein [Candidatus Humimicrobiaceae bacterium]
MEDQKNKKPKVFISYSHTSQEHINWVIELSERLCRDGIDVKLDQWDLSEGQDKYIFMEQMVKDEAIYKVLIICDKEYQKKANERKGGAGTESQIISEEVYKDVNQKKFIPIIKEYDDESRPCLPTYLKSRIYIDLSDESIYEDNYEKLVRSIHNKPLIKKPIIGEPPSYITNDSKIQSRTKHFYKQIENAVLNNKTTVSGLLQDFFINFFISLDEEKILEIPPDKKDKFDEVIINSINNLKPLRNDFINVSELIFKYDVKIELDYFKDFLEKLLNYKYRDIKLSHYYAEQFDNFKFLIYELVLYFITILIKLNKFQIVSYFTSNTYFFNHNGELIHNNISEFNSYIKSLEEFRKNRLNLNDIKNISASIIEERADYPGINFQQILETDYLLFFITVLKNPNYFWYPRLGVYFRPNSKINILAKLVSKNYFEMVKCLFNVGNKNELINLIIKIKDNNRIQGVYSYSYEIPEIEKAIDLNAIGSID